jgi:hypothetical protein
MSNDNRAHASAYVNTDGTTTRKRGVAQTYKEGTGIIWLIWPLDRALRSGEFHFSLTGNNAATRVVQQGNGGNVAPPGGANAPAGSTGLKVLITDAAGVAADSEFSFEARKV